MMRVQAINVTGNCTFSENLRPKMPLINPQVLTVIHHFQSLGLNFFITWFMDFCSNIKVGGENKIKIKITKKFFLFNLKHIWIGEKKKKKLFDFTL